MDVVIVSAETDEWVDGNWYFRETIAGAHFPIISKIEMQEKSLASGTGVPTETLVMDWSHSPQMLNVIFN